ncbi:MAG: TolC family protein [Bacteroidia bacterium]
MLFAKIRLSGLLLIALTAVNVEAQKLWSLDECLDYALENNLSLKQNRLNIKQAEINFEEAKFRRYPSLNGSINNSYNFGRSIDPLTNANVQRNSANLRFGLSSGVILFNGFQFHSAEKVPGLCFFI